MAFSPAAKKRKGDNAASVVGSPGAASAQSGAQALSQRAAVGMSPKAPAKKPNSAPIEVFVWLYTKCGSDVFPGFPQTDLFGLRLRREAFPAVDSDILASFKMFLGEKNAENDDYPADLKELKDYERIIISLTQTPKDVEGRRVQTNMPLKEWSVMFWTDEPFHCMRLIADFSWWRAQHRRPADKSPWPDLSTLKMVVNPFVNVSMDGFNTDNITMPMTVNEPSTTLQCSIFESSPPGSSKMVEVRVQVIDQKTVFFAWEGRTFPYRERFDLKRIGREDNVRILPQARTDVSIADNAAFIRDVFKQGVLRDLLVHLVLEESSVPADGPVKELLDEFRGAAAADFEERSLNKWARQQEHLLRSRRLTEGRAQALQRWIPWGAGQKDSVWNQSYDSLRNWLRAHANRYPTRANNASKTEKSLRTFADNCRRLYNRSPASDAGIAVRRCELLRALPGWDTFAEQTSWDSNYQRLQEWLRTHCGAFPDSMGTSSTSPEELRLAGWIQRQRAAYHSVPRRAAGLHDDQQAACAHDHVRRRFSYKRPPIPRTTVDHGPAGGASSPAAPSKCAWASGCAAPPVASFAGLRYCLTHDRILRAERPAVASIADYRDSFFVPHQGSALASVCDQCGSHNFEEERVQRANARTSMLGHFSICCQNGKITPAQIRTLPCPPPELLDILRGTSRTHQAARAALKMYNHAFAFVSYGASCFADQAPGRGPPVVICHGTVYHNSGYLFPRDGDAPTFAQVYLYDHNEAVKARTDNPYHSGINADIVEHLQRMLDRVNPYVHQFRHMRDIVRNHNPTNVQLCISQTEGQDMRRYNKPQTYEPAVVFRSSDGVLHGTRAAAVAAGSETTLTAWFRLNAEPPDGFTPPARSLHYAEVPQFFSWNRSSFSDLATVVHSDGNRQTFYQRRWNDDTSTWENSDVPDYRRACEEQGFANSSDEYARCMEEAARLRSAPALRRLFAMLLLHCELASPVTLWQRFANDLCEDVQRHLSETDSENAALLHVQEALSQAGKTLTDFGLPTPTYHDVAGLQPRDVRRETAYDAEEEWTSARSHRSMMNDAQAIVFDQVADAVIGARPLAVFIDGPGGTGKTFVYKVLPVIPRVAREDLVQHSLLNHPLWRAGVVEVHALTENMRARGDADWQRFLLDIGDGRAPTFPDIHPEAVRLPDNIVAPSHWGPEDLARAIYADIAASAARCVGGDVAAEDLQYFCDRAILTPKNATADSVNVAILREAFPDTTVTYYSVDDVGAASPAERDVWPTDFLNSLTPSGLPPHELALAPGALVMLLRNLDADAGLVNDTEMPLAGAASSSDDAPAFLDEGSEAPPSPAARPRRFARDHGPDDVDEFGPAPPDDASANVVLAPLRQRGAVVDAPAPPETLFQTCAATENDNPSADSAGPMPSTQLRCEAASSSKQRERFTGFFERQRGAHCGMHALNNALGFALLDEGTMEASAHAFIEHAALDGLPQRLRDHMSPSGDYSEAVLAFVLQRCGNSFSLNLNAPVLPQDAMNIFAPNVVGVVVNQNNAHWIAVKAVSGRIWKLDSAPGDGRSVAEPVLCELSDFQKLLRRHPTAYPLLDIR
ncbi:unnamed protein product, partial [Prorocentrum cordatum]